MKKEKVHIGLKNEAFRTIEKMHRHKAILYVGMIGSALIFLFMIIAFAVGRPENELQGTFQLPKAFMLSTILLLFSSFSINKVLPSLKEGKIDGIKKWLGLTFLLGLFFSASQIVGWQELKSVSFFSKQDPRAYLYVVSGLHIAHMLSIMVFAILQLMACHKASKDNVKQLVYETNVYQKVKLEMLVDSWHFVDALWLVLFSYFFFLF